MASVGLLAIMLDEAEYVDRWIRFVRERERAFDYIIVVDGGSKDGTPEKLREASFSVISRPMPPSFADQRNFAISRCPETGWVFELDADELLSEPLVWGLREIATCADRDGVDCLGVPRLNFLDGTLCSSPGAQGLDYQYRLHQPQCRWGHRAGSRVHEEIGGWRARTELDYRHGHFIVHDKSLVRHEARNAMYRIMERP